MDTKATHTDVRIHDHGDAVVAVDELRALVAQIFCNCGVDQNNAAIVTDALIEANLRGHASHGVIRVPKWADGLRAGAINAKCQPFIVTETSSVALLDGDRGLGPIVADTAVKLAADKARKVGIGAVAVRRASHIAMLQYYASAFARSGLIGIIMTNTESGVAPFGGIDKILGTNPIAIGVPSRTQPLILDMSTSQVARGKLVVAKSRGEPIPAHWAIDSDGRPTTDPEAALSGALLPIAGPKGSGLAIMIDLLTGGLAGASVGLQVRGTFDMEREGTKGDFFLALDPDAFGGLSVFQNKESDLKADVRSSRLAPGAAEILLPGEMEMAMRRKHLLHGIPIEASLLAELEARADQTDIC